MFSTELRGTNLPPLARSCINARLGRTAMSGGVPAWTSASSALARSWLPCQSTVFPVDFSHEDATVAKLSYSGPLHKPITRTCPASSAEPGALAGAPLGGALVNAGLVSTVPGTGVLGDALAVVAGRLEPVQAT